MPSFHAFRSTLPFIGASMTRPTLATTQVSMSAAASAAFRGPTPLTARVTVAAAVFLATLFLHSPAHATDDSESLPSVMTRLRVQESPQPLRENPQWRP